MALYKLNYFNLRARGEVVRLVFAAAGQKYEDNRFEFAQWPQYKALSPLGTCPWLEIHDGNKVRHLGQSNTIGKHILKSEGLFKI